MRALLIGLAFTVMTLPAAAGCPTNLFGAIKKGHFSPKTFRAFNIMISMQVRDRGNNLREMIEAGTIVSLAAGKRACI